MSERIKQFQIKVIPREGGDTENKTFLGLTKDEAKAEASDQGYQVISLDNEITEIAYGKSGKPIFYSKKIKKKDILLFFELFSNLEKLPLKKQVEILKKQSWKYIMTLFFEDMALNLHSGKTVYQILSLKKWSHFFSHNQLELIKVGEETKNLTKTLRNLSIEQRNELETKAAIISSLVYPCIFLITLGICSSVMFGLVLPQIESFVGEGTKPPLAQLLFDIKDFVTSYGITVIIGVITLYISLFYFTKGYTGKRILHKILLKIPAVKALVKARAEMQISKILEFSSSAQMTPLQKINLLSTGVDNLVYREYFINNIDKVRHGSRFHVIFENDTLFSSQMQAYIETGDINHNLDDFMLLHYNTTLKKINGLLKVINSINMFILLILMASVVIIFAGGILQLIIGITDNYG